MVRGTIILLNGASSSGKSTIAKELQGLLPGHYLHLGIDQYMERVPESFDVLAEQIPDEMPEGFLWIMRGGRLQETRIGPYGYRVIEGMYLSYATFAELGVNIIVDDVIFDPTVLQIAARVLKEFKVYFVGVHCPLKELEAREAARGDRLPGLAAAHHKFISSINYYDIQVDTSVLSASQASEVIRDYVLSANPPKALKEFASD